MGARVIGSPRRRHFPAGPRSPVAPFRPPRCSPKASCMIETSGVIEKEQGNGF